MKKLLGLILTLCLVFAFTADALAARPKIVTQPETAVTDQKGAASFSIKTSGDVRAIIWHFIDPAAGTDLTGTKLEKNIKGLKVSGPTNKTIKLYHVPESMHGWTVYCQVNGNGYRVESDRVMLLVHGLEAPDDAGAGQSAEPDSQTDNQTAGQDGEASTDTGSQDNTDPLDGSEKIITVTCSAKALRTLDSSDASAADPVSTLQFTNAASFIVTSADAVKSWTINGVRFEPDEPVYEFTVTNATSDVTITLNTTRTSAASIEIDESRMCRVTCVGCTFTYIRGGLRSVTEGEVPAGAPINVIADSSEQAASGYVINGADPVSIGLGSFRFIVNEDVTISLGH